MHRRTVLSRTAFAVATSAFALVSHAAGFPEKPIRLVVPFPPGGTADTIARTVAMKMSDNLKQQVIVDFKPGAATIIGADAVAHSVADGYTIFLGSATTFVVNPIIYDKLPYNAATSFEPLGVVGSNALTVNVNANVPAKTFADLMKLVKADPAQYNYGSHGNGSTVHFAAEMLWAGAGIKVTHIPYKGSAPAMTDLMAGQIPISFDAVPASLAAAKGGKIRVLAVTGKTRSPLLPDVPTIVESGFPNVSLEAWWAVVAPKGLPSDVKSTLVKAVASAVSDKEVQQKLQGVGFDVKYGAPQVYFDLMKEDTVKLAPIAKANNIKPD